MGKESEVLQAAQEGNISKLETLFTQKRFGGLLKGPNINARDTSGCTALHLAALHGNIDAVVFLLDNDASANVPDNAGSFPLHLAAFNGHYEVANTLITKGPSRAQVNEANMAGDTALHVGAQYGHENVVRVLLGKYADASLRNSKDENALDLAAQYGRLATVERFLTVDATLYYKGAVHKHSPLHLAARNGHVEVVKALLDHGMSINSTCDMGTALHCASLFGKVSVAKLLLEKGIDIEIENDNGDKVLDLLVKHPSQTSQEITALIYAHSQIDEREMSRSPAASYSGQQFELVDHPKRIDNEPRDIVSQPSGYDVVPPPRPKPKTSDERPYSLLGRMSIKSSSDDEENLDRATVTPLVKDKENIFQKFDDSQPGGPYCLVGEDVSPIKSKKSVKQKRTSGPKNHAQSLSNAVQIYDGDIGGTYCEVSPNTTTMKPKPPQPFAVSSRRFPSNTEFLPAGSGSPSDSIYQSPPKGSLGQQVVGRDDLYQVPPTFQNRNSRELQEDLYQVPPTFQARHSGELQDDLYQVPPTFQARHSGGKLQDDLYQVPPKFQNRHSEGEVPDIPPPSPSTAQQQLFGLIDTYGVPASYSKDTVSGGSFSKPRSQTFPVQIKSSASDTYNNVNLQKNTPTESYDNVQLRNSPATESYDNVNITNKQNETNVNNTSSDLYYQRPPSSSFTSTQSDDMYYQNPPTNFKPKPAKQPLNQRASSPSQYTSVKVKSMKQKRTATIVKKEIDINEDVKPPVYTKNIENPKTEKLDDDKELVPEKTVEQAKEDLLMKATSNDDSESVPIPKPRMKQSRTSVRRVESGYRMSHISAKKPLDESYEWSKIDEFLSNLEEFAGSNPCSETKPLSTKSVTEWLESLQMSTYEPMFLANGFDDIEFINGCLDDQDLIELGILDSDHRRKIMEATNVLVKISVIGEDGIPIPPTVSDWLHSIKLDAYENRFMINGYGNLDRVRVIWELELVTVLDISAIGHRKRMLNSLGRRPPQIKAPVSWAKRFADADAGRSKNNMPDDTMDVAQQLMETAKDLTISRDTKKLTDGGPQSPRKSQSEATPSMASSSSEQFQSRKHQKDGWIHSPDVLMYEYVAYSAQYLGSHPVSKVKGVESTLDACSKMKILSQNVHKMPSIVLSISVRGIDYIDSNSKMIINQYGINHISFIAQDPDDLNVFAYITRDETTRKNYCHVFKAKSTRQADEIVLTLGQCFELAYEQHMALMEIKKSQETQKPSPTDNQSTTSREPPPCPKPYAGH